MPDDDFAALCADIKANGLIQPIVLFESHVIDGWHRYRACVETGIAPRSSLLPQGADPVAFVLACNLHRRHLTASQRALAVVACHAWRPSGMTDAAIKSSRAAPGAALETVARGAGSTTAEMAAEADVSERTIRQAKAVAAKAAPEVVEAVKAGKVSVKTAAAKTSKPKATDRSAKKSKPILAAFEPDPDMESPAELMADMHKDIERLTGLLAAADADDRKAEVLKWRRAYDVAVRGQSDAMDRAHKCVEREKWIKKQLMRCGRAVGEDDEFKIASAVEAMDRAYKLAAKRAESEASEPDDDDGPSAEEIAAAQREAADDQNRLQLLLDADEPLAAANARIKEQAAQIRILEERVRGLTSECAAAIRQAKSWCTKFEKLERTGVAA